MPERDRPDFEIGVECTPHMTIAGVLELENWEELIGQLARGDKRHPLRDKSPADMVAAIWAAMEEARRCSSGSPPSLQSL
jgi:hypothetical protein